MLSDELTIAAAGPASCSTTASCRRCMPASTCATAAYVEDLASRNGTLVNGQPLQGALQLRRGDRVQFGQTTLEAVR